jgi:hypothetical protein
MVKKMVTVVTPPPVVVPVPKKIEPVTFKSFSSKRKFGVEFEVSAKTSQATLATLIEEIDKDHEIGITTQYHQDHNNNFWNVKFDRSCSDQYFDYGWEISSFVASGAKDLILIEKVAKRMHEYGVSPNKNCAFHVHVECREVGKKELGIIQSWWLKFENIFLAMVSPYRYRGKYSKPLRPRFLRILNKKAIVDNKINSQVVYETMLPHPGGTASGWANKDRRTALNVCNMILAINDVGTQVLNTRKTLELRLPEGTLDYMNVRGWVRVFISFIESALEKKEPENFASMSINDFFKFIGCSGINHIPSKAMYELKIWVLSRIIAKSDKFVMLSEAKSLLLKTIYDEKEALDLFEKTQATNNFFRHIKPIEF